MNQPWYANGKCNNHCHIENQNKKSRGNIEPYIQSKTGTELIGNQSRQTFPAVNAADFGFEMSKLSNYMQINRITDATRKVGAEG